MNTNYEKWTFIIVACIFVWMLMTADNISKLKVQLDRIESSIPSRTVPCMSYVGPDGKESPCVPVQ
jgi:hypothetical protein